MGADAEERPTSKLFENLKQEWAKVREYIKLKKRRPIDKYYALVPKPGIQYCIHVSIRSIQTSALLGSIMAPVTALMMHRQDKTDLIDAFVRGGLNGAMVGAALGPAISLVTCKNMNRVSKFQKYMKSKYDDSMLWQDHIAVASAAVGLLSHGKIGMVVGLDLSLIFALITSRW